MSTFLAVDNVQVDHYESAPTGRVYFSCNPTIQDWGPILIPRAQFNNNKQGVNNWYKSITGEKQFMIREILFKFSYVLSILLQIIISRSIFK